MMMNQTPSMQGYVRVASAVEGIEVFAPRPKEGGAAPEVQNFTCPQCGASIAYQPDLSSLTCSHCGYQQKLDVRDEKPQIEQHEFTVETVEKAARGWAIARKDLECQNCGAVVSIPVEELTHTCSFCGSNKVIQRQASEEILRPKSLIPFSVTPKQSQEIAARWLGSSWMTYRNLSQVVRLEAFKATYLPYWAFCAVTPASWRAEVGHTETERYYDHGEWKERSKTVWRWESGSVKNRYTDLLIDGTRRVSKLLLSRIKDFTLNSLVPYDPRYLAGIQALAYDITLEKAWEEGRAEMRDQTRKTCISQASTSQVRNFSMQMDFQDETWRYVLLPFYLSSFTHEGRVFQVVLNGQNGQITGQRPVDWNKVWLVIALLLSPGLLFSMLGLITLIIGVGAVVGGIGLVLLVIGVVISVIIYMQAQGLDDA